MLSRRPFVIQAQDCAHPLESGSALLNVTQSTITPFSFEEAILLVFCFSEIIFGSRNADLVTEAVTRIMNSFRQQPIEQPFLGGLWQCLSVIAHHLNLLNGFNATTIIHPMQCNDCHATLERLQCDLEAFIPQQESRAKFLLIQGPLTYLILSYLIRILCTVNSDLQPHNLDRSRNLIQRLFDVLRSTVAMVPLVQFLFDQFEGMKYKISSVLIAFSFIA